MNRLAARVRGRRFGPGVAGAGAGAIGAAGPLPVWAWRSSDLALAPYIGSGTPTVTRAGNTATIINSSGLIETVNANLARYDYTVGVTADQSGKGRHAYSYALNMPTAVSSPLAGIQFDGVLALAGSQGLNAGAAGFGVSDADGSMEVSCEIRRNRTGNAEFLASVARRDGISFNWCLYINTSDKLGFGMRSAAGTFVESVGTTSLGTGSNYTVKGRWTGTQLIVTVNGTDEGTPTSLTALTAHDGTALTIGRATWDTSDATNPHTFSGTIANLKMYRGGALQGDWPLTTITRTPGLRVEAAATNIALHNRDLTQAAWVAGATMTVAKDQTGVDGAANSASSLTGGAVTATNTCLQTVVLASSSRVMSAWVKRLVGTGTIEMTTDGGTTYRNITSRVTSGWTRISIPAQTVTNPVFGFRITTDTDSIAVDFVQNETGRLTSNTTATGAATVTRAADVVQLATSSIGGFSNTTLGVYTRAISHTSTVLAGDFPMVWGLFTDNSNYIAAFRNNSATDNKFKADVVNGGASQASLTLGPDDGNQFGKSFVAVQASNFAGVAGGNAVQTDSSGTVPTVSTLQIGGFNSIAIEYWGGWLFDMEIYNVRPNNAFILNKVS